MNDGDSRPNFEKFKNLTSPSKLKGIASCLMILVISSTKSSYKIAQILKLFTKKKIKTVFSSSKINENNR